MKRLVLCCDGTWNSADQERNGVPAPTNVVKLAYRVAKRDGATLQVIYYDQGVGTGNFFDRLTGGAFGDGVKPTSATPTAFSSAITTRATRSTCSASAAART